MPEQMFNCREVCKWARYCSVKSSNVNPDTCYMAIKLEDYWWDAECDRMGARREEREADEDHED